MTSQFDMNQPSRVCPICVDVHPITNPCKYDKLVKIIHTQKEQIVAMLKGNKELFETAKMFQKIIKDIEPELFRLVEVEKKYKELMGESDGSEELQAEASKQLSFEGLEPAPKNTQYVRPPMGIVPTEISETKS